jgi:hypothetical protein
MTATSIIIYEKIFKKMTLRCISSNLIGDAPLFCSSCGGGADEVV